MFVYNSVSIASQKKVNKYGRRPHLESGCTIQKGRELAEEAVWQHVPRTATRAHWMDKEPTDAELTICIRKMQNGRAAGEDGFLAEFLKFGSTKLRTLVFRVVRKMWRRARGAGWGRGARVAVRVEHGHCDPAVEKEGPASR